MSIEKMIVIIVLAVEILGFFLLFRIKKFAKFQAIGELGLFLSIICAIIFFCLDQNVFSTEHEGIFYITELIVILSVEIIAFIIYFVIKFIKKPKD